MSGCIPCSPVPVPNSPSPVFHWSKQRPHLLFTVRELLHLPSPSHQIGSQVHVSLQTRFFSLFVLLLQHAADICSTVASPLLARVMQRESPSGARSRSKLPDIRCLPQQHKRTSGLEPAHFLLIKTRKGSKPQRNQHDFWVDSGMDGLLLFLLFFYRIVESGMHSCKHGTQVD